MNDLILNLSCSCIYLLNINFVMEELTYFPGQEPPKQEQQTYNLPNQQRIVNEQYTTNITELISEPASESVALAAAHYIFSSLYQLSSYLFFKKINQQNRGEQQEDSKFQMSFNSYLQQTSEELGRFGKTRTSKQNQIKREAISMESELIRCYQQVDQIYFQEKFVLDFSYFQLFYSELKSPNREERSKVNNQLDKLIESLDLVEVNLFSQIHCKFHEYFAAAANFEYLHQSVLIQLKKLTSSRTRIQKVKLEFVDKSVKLRLRILQRQNIEKVLKLIKTIKSIKKLPQVMESILASSLPYECLELLQKTKKTLESVKNLKSLTNTADSVRQMEVLAQNDLSKRYASELYLYLEECHSKEFVHLADSWKKIQVRFCLDKDSSLVIDELNSSSNSGLSQNPHILDELQLMDNLNKQQINKKTLLQRHEGREYQIAMILLQSYKYVNFSPEVTKIKVCNALRIFCKRFEKQLMVYLNQIVTQQINNRNQQKNSVQPATQTKPLPSSPQRKSEDTQEIESTQVVQKVSVDYYVKHVGVLNQIFKQTISRFLGYLQTLTTEYSQQLNNEQLKQKDPIKLQNYHNRFKSIFAEECSLLPSIFKIIEEKLKYLLTLKNISSITSFQFYQWISTFKYWQRYFEYLTHSHPLLNYHEQHPTYQHKIQQLCQIVAENVNKAVTAMGLKTLLCDLTIDYIKVYHKNTLNNQIINTLQEDTWQSTQIPPQFSDILSSVLNPQGMILNSSITILDSSSTSSKGNNTSREMSKNDLSRQQSKLKSKFKLLKNNIMVNGIRYKVNLSFLVLCQVIDQYLKMSRILGNILPKQYVKQTGFNKITAFIFQKIFDLIQQFSNNSRELILETKALKFQKIKGKSINAKHICLLCNCLSVVLKISEQLVDGTKIDTNSLALAKASATNNLQSTINQLIAKLALILSSKIQKQINDYLNAEKQIANTNNTKTNTSIVTAFIQMVEISDQYLDTDTIKKVLKPAFQILSQRYFTHLLQKGGKYKAEVQLLAQKMKFLRKYFVNEYEALLKDIPN